MLIEYIRSVGRSLMVPIDPLMAMLIDLLMSEEMYYELHQLLQVCAHAYHIIFMWLLFQLLHACT